jgi:hypothetical protein
MVSAIWVADMSVRRASVFVGSSQIMLDGVQEPEMLLRNDSTSSRVAQ